MSILVNKNSKVVVQGITGSEGTFHTNQMIEYGTNIVAGVTPGKGGTKATDYDVPVYNSVEDAKKIQRQIRQLFLCHQDLLLKQLLNQFMLELK